MSLHPTGNVLWEHHYDVPTIAYYNQKGGIGKTTNVHAHARSMAETYKLKVLMVDCDSQRNLTFDVCGGALNQYYATNPNGTYSSWINRSGPDGTPVGRTLPQMLRPLFNNANTDLMTVELMRIPGVQNGQLFLLAGDEEITDLDKEINKAEVLQAQVFTTRNYLAAPYYAVMKAAKSCQADLVILDLSPSNGELNKVLTLTSTHLLMPTVLDIKALEGMLSICKRLVDKSKNGWCWWGEFVGVRCSKDSTFKFPSRRPKFLGWTLNNYDIQRRGDVIAGLREDRLAKNYTGFFHKTCLAVRQCIENLKRAHAESPHVYEQDGNATPWKIPQLHIDQDAYRAAKEIDAAASRNDLELLGRTSDFNQWRVVAQNFYVPVAFISEARGELVRFEEDEESPDLGEFRPVNARSKAKAKETIDRHRQDLDRTVKVILRLLRHDYPHLPLTDANVNNGSNRLNLRSPSQSGRKRKAGSAPEAAGGSPASKTKQAKPRSRAAAVLPGSA